MMQDEKTSRISNPERIARVIKKLCQSKVQALIRPKEDASVGIRSTFHLIGLIKGQCYICLNDISDRGLKKLGKNQEIRVEVLGMPSRIVFDSSVERFVDKGIYIPLPRNLASTERRKNARFQTTAKQTAYLKLGMWSAGAEDLGSPPVLRPFENLSSMLYIADISLGGICVLTSFPSVLKVVEQGKIDEKAGLIFPGMPPLNIKMEFRWQKRTLQSHIVNGRDQSQIQFRFGAEFRDLDEDSKLKVKQFMRQLIIAEAI
jgi:hypothetical protein